MAAFTITVSDQAVREALHRLVSAGRNMTPILQTIGDDMVRRAEQRFVAAVGPDGKPWAANSGATLARYLQSRNGGAKGKKGRKAATPVLGINKRPLTDRGYLADSISASVINQTLIVSNSREYAAIQQFGGTQTQFPHLWGDIPARPFLPITAAGQLYPQERELILAQLAKYIQNSVHG